MKTTAIKRIIAALALAFAIGHAQTARADYWDWVGKGSGQTSYFDDYSNKKGTNGSWYHSVATSTDKFAQDNHNFASVGTSTRPAFNSGWDYKVTFRNVTSMTGAINIEYSTGKEITFVATAADKGVNSSASLSLIKGAVKINSGTYTFSTIPITGGSTLTLDGGTLTTSGEIKIAGGSTLTMNGGTLTPGYFQLGNGNAGALTMNGGTLKNKSGYPRIGAGSNGTGVFTVKTGAVFDTSESSNKNMTLGQDSGATGTLNVEGGDVTVAGYLAINYNAGSKNSVVNITDGGVLTVGYMTIGGTGTSTININNGTIKARNDHANFIPAHNDLTLYVGNGGATFDTDSHDITIGADISDAAGETGSMSFTGGGKVTLVGAVGWTGATTLDLGTVIGVTDASKSALLANLTVAIPAGIVEDNTLVLTNAAENGVFSAADIADIAFTGDAEGRYSLVLADGDTTVRLSDTLAGEYVWNDGDSGASWRTSGKWSKNGVAGDWYDSTAAAFENAGDTVTVDSAVTAASVEFRANATVSGSAALTVPSVTVASGVSAEIAAPTAGPLEKTGAGTLTLSQNRTGVATVLSEGTLAMSGTASLDWSQFTFGTDAAKPVALHIGANATIANILQNWSIGNVEGLKSTFVKNGGDLTVVNIYLSGKTGAETSFAHNGGLLSVGGCIDIGLLSEAHFEIAGGMVTNTANYIHMSPNSSPADMTVRTGAKYGMSANKYGIIVSGRASGTLNVQGGDVFANGPLNLCYRGGDATVNVTDGGVLAFNKIQYNAGGADDPKGGTAAISIDDGTIRANANDNAFIPDEDNLTVTVGANGGTIDVNGKTITMEKELAGTGGMVFKGGGTVTLSVAPAYSGKTTVEVGTVLVVPTAIAGADLAFAIPDGFATGVYKVMEVSGGGAFASDVLSSATMPSGANAGFFFDNDNKEIWCAYSSNAGDHIWIGGASGSLNDGANWLSGNVPASGTAIIGSASAATLTNPDGSAFAARHIIVPKDSAAVTVSGAAFSGITQIANNSTSQVEFQNAVTFAANVNVIQSPGIVKFTGGATGTQLGAATAIHGTYNFTATGDLVEIAGTTVKSDGVYNLPNATFFKHNGDFHMDAGGLAVVKNAKIRQGNSDKHLLGTFNGEFKVTGEFLVSGDGAGKNADSWPTHYVRNAGNGTLIANKIRTIENGCLVIPGKTIMGSEGIVRGAGYVRLYNSGSHEIGSCADWVMYHNNRNNTTSGSPAIYKRSSSSWTTVTFDTTDYYDNTIARTITCEAPIGAANADSATKLGVTVKGKGKFVFANTSDGNIFSGGLTVNDSATVEVKANAWPGKGAVTLNGTSTLLMHTGGAARTGAITVNSGATLEVAETSGTASLGGALTIESGAALKFKLSGENNATLALTSLTLNATTESKALIEFAAGSVKPIGQSYTLTSGGAFTEGDEQKFALPEGDFGKLSVNEDGNLVYTAPKYFYIKVK